MRFIRQELLGVDPKELGRIILALSEQGLPRVRPMSREWTGNLLGIKLTFFHGDHYESGTYAGGKLSTKGWMVQFKTRRNHPPTHWRGDSVFLDIPFQQRNDARACYDFRLWGDTERYLKDMTVLRMVVSE